MEEEEKEETGMEEEKEKEGSYLYTSKGDIFTSKNKRHVI